MKLFGCTFFEYQPITRADGQPYLYRWLLFRCPLFSVMVHKFVGSDDACTHDHPWPFRTFILAGGYWEWIGCSEQEAAKHKHATLGSDGTWQYRRWVGPGASKFAPADRRHRVELDKGRPAWSLVVTGRKTRSWGFWTPFGWVHWTKYSHVQHCPS